MSREKSQGGKMMHKHGVGSATCSPGCSCRPLSLDVSLGFVAGYSYRYRHNPEINLESFPSLLAESR